MVTVAYPIYGFAAEKGIPKVVSDGEINTKKDNKKNAPTSNQHISTVPAAFHDSATTGSIYDKFALSW